MVALDALEDDLTNLHVAIVGAGVMGMHSAVVLTRRGARVTIVEREACVGGVWRYFANDGSRVQISEPGYRLIPDRVLSDFTPKQELLRALEDAGEEILSGGGTILYNATMERVLNVGEAVNVRLVRAGVQETLTVDHVLLCVGGLQNPRKICLPNEKAFKGVIIDGIAGEPDRISMKGQHVVVLGMGAFAVENARECLFNGAAHVTFLVRHRNLIAPQLLGYLGFLAEENYMPIREQYRLQKQQTAKSKARVNFNPNMLMVQSYRACRAETAMPAELQEFERTQKDEAMLRRESFGTVATASDPFFIGHALGKMSTIVGEVAEMLPDAVKTSSGQTIKATVVIKNFGFEDPDEWIASVVNQTHMHCPIIINERVWLFKCERARMTPDYVKQVTSQHGRHVFGDMLNIPPIAPALADAFLEIFCYFQARPEKLRALLLSEQLPHVPLGRCTPLTWSQGQWAMMQSDPLLAERVNKTRRQVAIGLRERWTPEEYFSMNRDWWRYCCKRIGGDEQSVPYVWEHLLPVMQAISRKLNMRSEQRSRL